MTGPSFPTLLLVLMVLTTVGHPTTQPTPPVTHPAAFDSIGRLLDSANVAAPIAPLDLDIRVMVWAPTAMVPVPFLRLTKTPGGDLKADFFVWWLASSPPSRLPANRRCSGSNGSVPVCIARIEIAPPDWGPLVVDVLASRACSMSLSSGPVVVVSDAGDLAVRVVEGGRGTPEEYWCNAPEGSSKPGAREAARVMQTLENLAKAASNAREASATQCVRASELSAAPRKIRDRRPEFSDLNVTTHAGVLVFDVTILPAGTVTDVRLAKEVGSNPPWPTLVERARSAISEWRFEPPTLNSKPVAVCMTVTVTVHVS